MYAETLKAELTFCEQPLKGIYLTGRFTGIASMSHVLMLFSVTQTIPSDLMQMLLLDHSSFVFRLPVGLLCIGKELEFTLLSADQYMPHLNELRKIPSTLGFLADCP